MAKNKRVNTSTADRFLKRDVNEDHLRLLRTALGLPEPDDFTNNADIPPLALKIYWISKQSWDRMSCDMGVNGIAQVAAMYNLLCNFDPDPAELKSIAQLVKEGALHLNDHIQVEFRGEWVDAIYNAFSADKLEVLVTIKGDESSELRRIPMQLARLHEPANA